MRKVIPRMVILIAPRGRRGVSHFFSPLCERHLLDGKLTVRQRNHLITVETVERVTGCSCRVNPDIGQVASGTNLYFIYCRETGYRVNPEIGQVVSGTNVYLINGFYCIRFLFSRVCFGRFLKMVQHSLFQESTDQQIPVKQCPIYQSMISQPTVHHWPSFEEF